MTEREKLIEIVTNALSEYCSKPISEEAEPQDFVTDYLLKNGVAVPPCKVFDKTFLLLERVHGGEYEIYESKCVRITDNGYGVYYSMAFDCPEIGNTLEFGISDFGEAVFLIREEAEKAFAERNK